jgi:PAS domain S-box-containing protein
MKYPYNCDNTLNKLINSNSYCIFAVDLDYNYTYCNDALLNKLDFTSDYLLSLKVDSLIHQEDLNTFSNAFNNCIEDSTLNLSINLRLRAKNEAYLGKQLDLSTITDDNGQVEGVLCLGTFKIQNDIENELLDNKILFSEGHAVIFKWSPDREVIKTLYVSENCKLFGYSSEELMGKSFIDFIHPDDFSKSAKSYIIAFEKIKNKEKDSPKYLELTYRFLCKDGNYKWVQDYSYPIFKDFNIEYVYGYIIDVNELVLAREMISESETRFKDMANSVPFIIWKEDANSNCTYVNKAWTEFTGENFGKSLGKGWSELVHEDDKGILDRLNRKDLIEFKPFEVEYRLKSANGDYRWVMDKGIPRFDSNNNFIGYIGSCVDLTDQKNAAHEIIEKNKNLEKALVEAERFSMIVNKTTNVVILADANGKIAWVNKAFTNQTGFSFEDAINQIPEDLIQGPLTDFKTKMAIKKAMTDRKSVRTEILNYTKTKETFWVELSIDPLYNNYGIFEGYIGILNDISERREIEDKIVEQNLQLSYFQKALNSSTYITIIDQNYLITEINQKFETISGFPKQKLIGTKPNIFIKGFLDENQFIELNEISKNKRYWRGEVIELKSDGSHFWLDTTVIPLYNIINEHIGFISVGINITNRLEYQQKLKDFNTILEQKITERTTILQNINEEKDHLLAIVSHDLKNPLAGLMLNIELLENLAIRNNDSILLNRAKNISKATKHMQDIISKILDAYRMETGNLSPKPATFLLWDLLKVCIDEISVQANNKNLNISVKGNTHIQMNNDYLFVYQIVDNLISNAIKYSKIDGEIQLDVSTKKGNLIFKVIDCGVGIPEDEIHLIFDKFSKVSSWPTAGEVKTGIGLSTVKKLSELLNGTITCKSKVDSGSVFCLTIPLDYIPTENV